MIDNKTLVLMGNSVSPAFQEAFSEVDPIRASIGYFGSGEPFVELYYKEEADWEKNAAFIKGKDVIVVQSAGVPVCDNSLHLLMMADTLKSYGAASVTVIMPFAPLMRQDRKFDRRFVSLGAHFFARQLKAAGVDSVITITPHSQAGIQAYQAVFGKNFKAVTTTQLFADDIGAHFGRDPAQIAIGAPDGADKPKDEGQIRAREVAYKLFGSAVSLEDAESAIFKISKVHTAMSDTKITSFEGDVAGKDCIIVDDMIDGGSTMINAAKLLKSEGARSVTCYATHGILSGEALEKILGAKADDGNPAIDKLVITDTLSDTRAKLEKLLAAKPQYRGLVEIITVSGLARHALAHMPPANQKPARPPPPKP